MTLHYLTDDFLKNYAEIKLRPATIRGYRTNIDKHILPHIGHMDIENISTGTLESFNKQLEGLSNKTKVYIHATLRKCLNYAQKRGYLLTNNPYDTFNLPRVEKYAYKTLSEQDMRKMLNYVKGWNIEAPVTMAICYGLRRGECLGIIPAEDLDAENCILHIQRTRSVEKKQKVITPCKTKDSNRHILVDKRHVKMLTEKAGQYIEHLTPSKLNVSFKDFLKFYNLPYVRFHDLRHSYATLMLRKGVNPKIVSGILGHAGVKTTLDIYSHADVSMQKACLEVWE